MEPLTPVQQELYDWLVEYIETAHHAPSIRQMMRAMNLRSSAPVQSRLEYLRKKRLSGMDRGAGPNPSSFAPSTQGNGDFR